MRFRRRWALSALLAAGSLALAAQSDAQVTTSGPADATAGMPPALTLDQCLEGALRDNRRRPASRFAVAIAEAQHRQALASYWPQVSASAAWRRSDQAIDMITPATTTVIPTTTTFVTIPAGVLGPTAVSLPVSAPMQTVVTPAQLSKLADRDNGLGSLNFSWLLYDGGLRRGYREQGEALVAMVKEDSRRTDLEIVNSVKRFYFGAVLARLLRQVGDDTLARMEATLKLTEAMYQGGGGKVSKNDFLETKVVVESVRAMMALLKKNEALAQAALANTMGLPWTAIVRPDDTQIPSSPFQENLAALVGHAYQFNPDWKKLEAGLQAAAGAVRTARSGHIPKLALNGDLHKWWNEHNGGSATAANKEGWTVGLGMEIPLFDGLLTTHKVKEAQARLGKIREEQILLREGLGLQIKDVFLGLSAAQETSAATAAALAAASENRDLTTRAYQSELVETEKVIRAQLLEAITQAQHYKARYDLVALRAQLDLLIGTDFLQRLTDPPARRR